MVAESALGIGRGRNLNRSATWSNRGCPEQSGFEELLERTKEFVPLRAFPLFRSRRLQVAPRKLTQQSASEVASSR